MKPFADVPFTLDRMLLQPSLSAWVVTFRGLRAGVRGLVVVMMVMFLAFHRCCGGGRGLTSEMESYKDNWLSAAEGKTIRN